MCASSGTKFSLMNEAVCSSLYDSASSRTHAPQAGAALKSTSKGLLVALASASAASASFIHCTFIIYSSLAASARHNLSTRTQTHQTSRERAEVFDFPRIAVSEPDSS